MDDLTLHYQITSATARHRGRGRCGFIAAMSGQLALAMAEYSPKETDPYDIGKLQAHIETKILEEMRINVPENDHGFTRLWWGSGLFIRAFHVGSDCACFGCDGSTWSTIEQGELPMVVEWSPHNIDTVGHGSALLFGWLLWFEAATSFLEVQLQRPPL